MDLLPTLAFSGMGWIGFDLVMKDREDPNQKIFVASGANELLLKRNQSGHYFVSGRINGRPVRFLPDAG
jgi:predicted aspartyl protease